MLSLSFLFICSTDYFFCDCEFMGKARCALLCALQYTFFQRRLFVPSHFLFDLHSSKGKTDME